LVDIAHRSENSPAGVTAIGGPIFNTALCIFAATGALFGTMALHQIFDVDPEPGDNRRWRRGILVGVVANVLGGAVLAMFILMKLWRQV
jgi:hypothetical protein